MDVRTTKSQTEQIAVARLPKPLATIYEKLKVFSRHYPQFNMSVKIKGLEDERSESNDGDIEKMYQRFDS